MRLLIARIPPIGMKNHINDKNIVKGDIFNDNIDLSKSDTSNSESGFFPENIPPKTKRITAVIAGVIIMAAILSLAIFFVLPKKIPAAALEKVVALIKPATQNLTTTVINFTIPDTLPTVKKQGYCWVNSVAHPYRADAWRCIVGDEIFDPCFSSAKNDFVFCQPDPADQNSAFLITPLTRPLPKPSVPSAVKDNWAWYMQLEDGTYCGPCVMNLPEISGLAYYHCQPDVNAKINDKFLPFGNIVPPTPRNIDTIIIYSNYNTGDDSYSLDGIIQAHKNANVSPHYIIDRQGNIYRMVADNDIALSAGPSKMPDGRTDINDFSIAIELIYKNTEGPNDKQYGALNELVDILEYNFMIRNILPYNQVSTTGKTSPWNFDLGKIDEQKQVVLLGELKKGPAWVAKKAILVKQGSDWILTYAKELYVKKVWK